MCQSGVSPPGSRIRKTSPTQRRSEAWPGCVPGDPGGRTKQLPVALGPPSGLSFSGRIQSPYGSDSQTEFVGSQLLRGNWAHGMEMLLLFRNSAHFPFRKGQDNAQNSMHLFLFVWDRNNFSSLCYSIRRLLREAPGDGGPAPEHHGYTECTEGRAPAWQPTQRPFLRLTAARPSCIR